MSVAEDVTRILAIVLSALDPVGRREVTEALYRSLPELSEFPTQADLAEHLIDNLKGFGATPAGPGGRVDLERMLAASQHLRAAYPDISWDGQPSELTERDILLEIPNHHTRAPLVDIDGRYVGYFANQHGEQLVFIQERDAAHAWLLHGDANWARYEVVDAIAPALQLDGAEARWLVACWMASSELRAADARE